MGTCMKTVRQLVAEMVVDGLVHHDKRDAVELAILRYIDESNIEWLDGQVCKYAPDNTTAMNCQFCGKPKSMHFV